MHRFLVKIKPCKPVEIIHYEISVDAALPVLHFFFFFFFEMVQAIIFSRILTPHM